MQLEDLHQLEHQLESDADGTETTGIIAELRF